jgi:phosphoglycolate phosphatase
MLKGYDVRKVIEYLKVPLWKVPLIAAYTRGLMAENIHQVGLFDGSAVSCGVCRSRGPRWPW